MCGICTQKSSLSTGAKDSPHNFNASIGLGSKHLYSGLVTEADCNAQAIAAQVSGGSYNETYDACMKAISTPWWQQGLNWLEQNVHFGNQGGTNNPPPPPSYGPQNPPPAPAPAGNFPWGWVIGGVSVLAIGGVVIWALKSKKGGAAKGNGGSRP